ncbi:MAG: hypothetical protein WAO21_10345 [Verrucomicrobiia bacterium]
MHLNSPELLQPVFDFLDGVIRDYGLYIFVGLVYLLIPFLVWTLSGGLRRKLLHGKPMPHVPPVIVIYMPVGRPTPPPAPFDPFPPYHELPCCGHDDNCCLD